MEARSCKVCKRTFPNGRSLGGHMRSHVMRKSSFNLEKTSESRYGLREKPKNSRCFDDEEAEREEKESRSTGSDDDQDEEMQMQTDFEVMRNRPRRRRSKQVEAIFASSSPPPSSLEYGALCLMMLSRGAVSISDETAVKGSESDILRIPFKKVASFPSESSYHLKDEDVEFKKDVIFAAVLESGKRSESTKRDFDTGTENFSKRSKYECTICNKSFHSYQALGGHCSSHKKIRADSSSVSAEVADHLNSQKFGSYECPICQKVYSTGQALGGHKRSHLIAGNSAAISTRVIQTEKKNSKLNSLDLNLPASDFEICESSDSNGSIGEEKFTAFQESCRLAAFMV